MTDRRQSEHPVLFAKGLTKGYDEGAKRRRVLEQVNFALGPGECVALLGRSGSGKSTLLNLLAGIDVPDAGELKILGHDITRLGEPALTLLRRRHIGFIYQFFNLIPTLTVMENLELPLELNGVPAAQRPNRIHDMLAKVGLGGRQQAFPDQLSGGEQQRVAIARAIIHEPSLVLADEPTGNLDAQTGHRMLDLLASLFATQADGTMRTMLLVTHSREVAGIAQRVLTLEQGQLLEQTDSGANSALSW